MASNWSKNNAAEIDRLALALAKEPGSRAFIPLAEEYGKAGMWQEAAGVLEDGLKIYPNFITAMVALGRTYEQLNQPVKAKAILEEAVKQSPENLRAHRTLAKIYAAQGSKDAALRSCDVILSVNPQDEEARSLRAGLVAHIPSGGPEPKAHAAQKAAEAATNMAPMASPPPTQPAEPTAISNASRQDSAQPIIAPAAPPRPSDRRTATVNRLEQWLSAIQTRRRDREQPRNSSTPTT